MTPFILFDLYFVMKQLMNVIILKEVLDREAILYKLIKIDLLKKRYISYIK